MLTSYCMYNFTFQIHMDDTFARCVEAVNTCSIVFTAPAAIILENHICKPYLQFSPWNFNISCWKAWLLIFSQCIMSCRRERLMVTGELREITQSERDRAVEWEKEKRRQRDNRWVRDNTIESSRQIDRWGFVWVCTDLEARGSPYRGYTIFSSCLIRGLASEQIPMRVRD